jgi:hypothetical protein
MAMSAVIAWGTARPVMASAANNWGTVPHAATTDHKVKVSAHLVNLINVGHAHPATLMRRAHRVTTMMIFSPVPTHTWGHKVV